VALAAGAAAAALVAEPPIRPGEVDVHGASIE
jgi:hypothetical protein